MITRYREYLEFLDKKLTKMFEAQKTFIKCKKGCAYCCREGEYPLSESQREAISCFEEIGEGEVLAVNGPAGTGKTTLLQSIVANMYVRAALERKRAPLIIATSTNNQAVTNIID